MEDLQVIIYIIFGIIYLIFGALKKRRKEQTGTPPIFDEEPEVDHREAPRVPHHQEAGSLEELLERYDQAAQRAKRRASEKVETMQEQVDDEFIPVAPRQPVIKNMEAEALEQMQRTEHLKSLQESLPAKDRAEILDRTRSEAIKPRVARPKAKKKVKAKASERRFKPYDTRKAPLPLSQQLRKLAHSRQGMKQAILMAEILNPKHF
ncbi:hypothetical protein [Cesiribacter sp. SM1]|uniref:hypothetical protein n=1 Tax=Cesiribacter sp. SM1 TaxID=2861196 RepID=UPI001CD5C6BD|nr:hypothetical protein [Cesiribacter sp. SM1]